MDKPGHFLLAAGGTGGHLFPAEALAEALIKAGHRVTIATDRRAEKFRRRDIGAAIRILPAATLKGGGAGAPAAIATMGLGILRALWLLICDRPQAVVGFGGYPSVPPVLAAAILRVPVLLHEQNGALGKANIFLSRFARAVALSLPVTERVPAAAKEKTIITGNPVREAVCAAAGTPYPTADGDFVLLVTGGSQAASVFADTVPAAAAALPPEKRARLTIMHQARAEDIARVAETYAAHGIRAEVAPFFSDIAARLAACHLFVGRSGASTVADVAAVGRPALFVPLHLADSQQELNAAAVTAGGGGWVVAQKDFTPVFFHDFLSRRMDDAPALARAAAAMGACGKPDAAAALARAVLTL